METNTKDLVSRAKACEKARDELVMYIYANKMTNVISRYKRTSRLLDADDIESEFWYGVFKALPDADVECGDPIHYLLYKGKMHVVSVLRKLNRNGIKYTCYTCGKEGNLYHKDGEYRCRGCSSTDITTEQRVIGVMDIYDMPQVKSVHINFVEIDLELIKPLLSSQQLRIFELIQEGIKEDNYIKAIAKILDITPQAVSSYIIKMRNKIRGMV